MLNRRALVKGGMGLLGLWVMGPARAQAPVTGPLTQGALLRGQTVPGAAVRFGDRLLRVSAQGHFVFGVAWDRKDPARLSLKLPDAPVEAHALAIAARTYKVQRINQLPGRYVTPDPSVMARIERENKLIGAARAFDTDEEWFAGTFNWPVRGPVTGVYGSRRILNGEERQPHFGIDVAAAEGVPILAPQAAIVRLAEKDLYYTGGTVILDHGFGVSTSYLHMSRLDVEVGQKLAQGDPIGLIGKTGRATGPHLCWRLNWFKERLDASLIVPPMKT